MIKQGLEMRSLKVDLEECYRQIGCCRLVNFVSRAIRDYVIHSTSLEETSADFIPLVLLTSS